MEKISCAHVQVEQILEFPKVFDQGGALLPSRLCRASMSAEESFDVLDIFGFLINGEIQVIIVFM